MVHIKPELELHYDAPGQISSQTSINPHYTPLISLNLYFSFFQTHKSLHKLQ